MNKECVPDTGPMSIARWSDTSGYQHCSCGNWHPVTLQQENHMKDAQFHQAMSLLQQAFDALESTADSDVDHFEDEEEEAEAVPAQYACRKIIEAMGLLKAA